MAHTTTCPLCGKAVSTGLFASSTLFPFPGASLYVCEDCIEALGFTRLDTERFIAKIENIKKLSRRKFTEEEARKLLAAYILEWHENRERAQHVKLDVPGLFFRYSEDGCFNLEEGRIGSISFDRDGRKLLKKLGGQAQGAFTAKDITCLQYRCVATLGDTWTSNVYVYEIRLGDPCELTHKPRVTFCPIASDAFVPHVRKRQAEQQLLEHLGYFKRAIGCSLPIEKIK